MRTFEISDKQEKKFKNWNKKHKKKCKYALENKPTEGGRLIFSFQPNGLGTLTVVQCICGDKCDLTDNSNW